MVVAHNRILWYNQGMGKPYTLLETREDGTEVRLYEDGSKRNQRGELLEYLDSGASIITPETARLLHAARKAKILAAIEAELTSVTRTSVPSEAIGKIVGKRAAIAMEDDSRAGNEAAKIVLSAVDAYQEKQPDDYAKVTRHEYAMDDETKALLHEMLRQRRDTDHMRISSDDDVTDATTDDRIEQ